MLGNQGQHGLSGRPLQFEELDQDRPPQPRALPPLCIRALQLDDMECAMQCAGVQPDGSCLAQMVRDRGGGEWFCEIDRHGVWHLIDQ